MVLRYKIRLHSKTIFRVLRNRMNIFYFSLAGPTRPENPPPEDDYCDITAMDIDEELRMKGHH